MGGWGAGWDGGDWRLNTLTGTPFEITHISRKGNGKERRRSVRYTGNQSLSNFRFHAEKTAEHTWPPPRCAAVFIAAPRPPAALCPTATQTHRKRHGYSQPWSISPNFYFCAKVANRSWCRYETDVISIRNKS